MNGIFNILKPVGMTSHDVVAAVRRKSKIKKVGHTGTLDPDASGVLPICVGRATRIADLLTESDKCYKAELKLGIETATYDASGEIIKTCDVNLNEQDITSAVKSFIGEYEQIPPMYSAIKVGGKKLYELARQGIVIERKPRSVKIYDVTIKNIDLCNNILQIVVSCSKGTYVRSLCHDIGEKLGCGGHMASLVRTKSSVFDIKESIPLSDFIEFYNEDFAQKHLMPIDMFFSQHEKIIADEIDEKRIRNGNYIVFKKYFDDNIFAADKLYRVYSVGNEFLAVYKADKIKELGKILVCHKSFFEV